MIKPTKLANRWMRRLGLCLSLTTIAFVFEACYGTPRDFGADKALAGTVYDKDNKPLAGIKIQINGLMQYTVTNADGYFEIYIPNQDEYRLQFSDTNQQLYKSKDTLITAERRQNSTNMRIVLDMN